ncbi:MAG TPA: S8 family serine peptidase, partial [Pyrinomonadaceae bacterium]
MLRRILASLSIASIAIVSLPLASFAAPARGRNSERRIEKKTAPEFDSTNNSTATVRVLMQTKGAPSEAHDGALMTARGRRKATYAALNTVVAEVPLNEIENLAKRSDVAYISPDRPVKSQINLTNETTGASQVQAGTLLNTGFDGKNITVAVLDSGISASHPDFIRRNRSRVIASVDFSGSSRAGDADGHGTGVAGVVAGNGIASEGYAGNYAGVAPGANLVDVRILDENGIGRASSVLAAFNWVIENKQRYNIRVVNLSMGTPVRESFHTDPLCKAVESAVRAGIVVVASAGNMGRTEEILGYNADGSPIYQLAYGAISSPANSPYAITVGATDSR